MVGELKHPQRTFAAGLLATVPIALTVMIMLWIFRWTTALTPIILSQIPSQTVQDLLEKPWAVITFRVAGLLVLLLLVYLVGLLTRNVVGRRLMLWLESILLRLPMVSILYGTLQQLGKAIFKGGGTGVFRQVVLVEYPLKGTFALGFTTAPAASQCNDVTGMDMMTVFVPTTPNPTSGFLLFLPKDNVKIVDMTVMQGMRLVISGGVVKPGTATSGSVDGTAFDE